MVIIIPCSNFLQIWTYMDISEKLDLTPSLRPPINTNFSYLSTKIYVVVTQKNCLQEMVTAPFRRWFEHPKQILYINKF